MYISVWHPRVHPPQFMTIASNEHTLPGIGKQQQPDARKHGIQTTNHPHPQQHMSTQQPLKAKHSRNQKNSSIAARKANARKDESMKIIQGGVRLLQDAFHSTCMLWTFTIRKKKKKTQIVDARAEKQGNTQKQVAPLLRLENDSFVDVEIHLSLPVHLILRAYDRAIYDTASSFLPHPPSQSG